MDFVYVYTDNDKVSLSDNFTIYKTVSFKSIERNESVVRSLNQMLLDIPRQVTFLDNYQTKSPNKVLEYLSKMSYFKHNSLVCYFMLSQTCLSVPVVEIHRKITKYNYIIMESKVPHGYKTYITIDKIIVRKKLRGVSRSNFQECFLFDIEIICDFDNKQIRYITDICKV